MQISLRKFDEDNQLIAKQIRLFSKHYDYNKGCVVQLEGYTHFAVSMLNKANINDFCLFILRDDDKPNDKGTVFVAPCHHILENNVSILVFERGSVLPVKAKPLKALYDEMSLEHFKVLYRFFGYK